jgi:hypothetical protein
MPTIQRMMTEHASFSERSSNNKKNKKNETIPTATRTTTGSNGVSYFRIHGGALAAAAATTIAQTATLLFLDPALATTEKERTV